MLSMLTYANGTRTRPLGPESVPLVHICNQHNMYDINNHNKRLLQYFIQYLVGRIAFTSEFYP